MRDTVYGEKTGVKGAGWPGPGSLWLRGEAGVMGPGTGTDLCRKSSGASLASGWLVHAYIPARPLRPAHEASPLSA